MAIGEECETCYWNNKTTSDGYIQCYKDKEWRKRKRCRELSNR